MQELSIVWSMLIVMDYAVVRACSSTLVHVTTGYTLHTPHTRLAYFPFQLVYTSPRVTVTRQLRHATRVRYTWRYDTRVDATRQRPAIRVVVHHSQLYTPAMMYE